MYNGTVEVKLDETQGKHQYQVTDSEKGLVNVTMRGVTDIKRTIIAKPGLMHWSKDEAIKWLKKLDRIPTEQDYEKASKAYLIKSDFGKDVGTEVHGAIENYLVSDVTTSVSQDARKSFNAFLDWYTNTNAKKIAVEQAVYSRSKGYCGKYDALLELDGKKVLVDFKTTNISPYALKKGKEWTGLYPEDFMQLGFYSKAYNEGEARELPIEKEYVDEEGANVKEYGESDCKFIDDLMLINCTKDGKLITLTASEIGWSVEDCENLAMNALDIADGLKNIKKGAIDMEMYK